MVATHGGAFSGSWRQAEPAVELARLRCELARVIEERRILRKSPRTLRENPGEIRDLSGLTNTPSLDAALLSPGDESSGH